MQERAGNIKSCFKKDVKFKYPHSLEDYNMLLDLFQRKTEGSDCNGNISIGEDNVSNKLIVMDDVSGLAGKSAKFANFVTASGIFKFTCVYVFHTIYPTRSNWQMILSQTKIFNIFPGSH